MADEFFRGAFTNGVWANGEVAPGLWAYNVAVGNNFSQLGITAKQLDRGLATGGSMWWMPTTHEFGPNGSLWRLGVSREAGDAVRLQHDAEPGRPAGARPTTSPENTQTRLADSLSLFETGSLARASRVNDAHVRLLSFDAGTELTAASSCRPKSTTGGSTTSTPTDRCPSPRFTTAGFYVQGAFYPDQEEARAVRRHVVDLRRQGRRIQRPATSISWAANVFWFDSRNVRSNFQVISVDHSPASSTFGFYVGGQTGTDRLRGDVVPLLRCATSKWRTQ